jgi:glutathione S-transferase
MQLSNELLFPALSTIITLCVYFAQSIYVSRARAKYGIKAPKTHGQDDFERYFRVHYNTLESLPIFITLLWLFALTVSATVAGWLGLLWSLGRIGYMYGYYKSADKRHSYGSGLSYIAILVFLLGTLWAIVSGLLA